MRESDLSERKIELTADGSATIYLPRLDEHYHSVKGAMAEARHVYVGCGLHNCPKSQVRVLEVGFGTGLSATATALDTGGRKVDYFSLELYPLPYRELAASGYFDSLEGDARLLMERVNQAEWGKAVAITPDFTIHKLLCDITDPSALLPQGIDVVYFDAFAPEKQPEMWSEEIFRRLSHAMNPGATLTTYCAKGVVRRLLQSLGFTTSRLPGPPGGKREILRATLPAVGS